jgi:imidazolonepropionase-like amidohydrolase/Tol biopolymer transport system component
VGRIHSGWAVACGMVLGAQATLVNGAPGAGAWSVANPPHLTRTATVDVVEGTWMNVDVSPDGRSIAFDLLGDIYLMPLQGGIPRQLLGGMAWEAQPRFSPDGSQIAFVSDRSGAKNVWRYRLRDGEVRQVTDEQFRTPSVPAWSPDGRWLIMRKHYTTRRTIGAGEIWRIPAEGGAGERLIEGESGQKDINEPVYSPDGESFFFSKDIDPDLQFRYDRDVHKGLFSILRFEIASGRQTTVAGAAGGAIRPVPSPDGRRLAYVKRNGVDVEGLSSALMLRDLRSGEEHVLDGKLDQDMQELWANDGYYPAYAWLPDSSGLVYWARGKIHRLKIADRSTSVVPFRIKAQHRMVEVPPRHPVPLSAERFPVKALRWVTVSPDGRALAYQALGKIYVRNQADGAVRRLTREGEAQEFYPAFSPDGEWVVYTTWDERALGQLKRTHVRSGETVVLSREPAHYVEPVVTADGIVVRKAPKGVLLDPRWTVSPGLHRIPWAGGEATLLDEEAKAPQVCDGGRALYATLEVPRGPKPPTSWWTSDRKLVRVQEGGSLSPPLAVSLATEYRLSPDCRWLARADHEAIILTRLLPGRDGVLQVSSVSAQFTAPGDGGAYPSWSSDGTLYWALGPDLYSWRIGEEGPLSAPVRTAIGFEAPAARPQGVVALRGGRIITMRGEQVIDDGTVVIDGNKIVAVGPTGEIAIPASARVLDLGGRTVIPGLVDNHGHIEADHHEEGIQPRQNWGYYAFLSLGITTLFDPAAPNEAFSAGELSRAGVIVAPRIFSTGRQLHDIDSEDSAAIDSLEDARQHARRRKAWGAIAIKSYLQPRRSQRQQIVEAARLEGLSVVTETLMGKFDGISQIHDGNTGIEHAIPLARMYDDVVQLWRQSDVDMTPTLVTGWAGLSGTRWGYRQERVWEHPILSRYVPPDVLRPASIRAINVQRDDMRVIPTATWLNRLATAGVRVLPSGHGEREGMAVLWEMELFAEGGMRPIDVIAAGTIRSAEHLGMQADIGSIEAGKLADLVVLDADPLADVRNLARVHAVIANGRHFDPMKMDDSAEKLRAPFYWEEGR